ncbi:hypothetical protein IMZ31_20125 (plasmid) [Pontibacillus sp. ALD_SL1]|uniref:hypothetical protein n=1 Tax=Pontibacillus sp. ALD_SL1 TaxID=2777185 RepID=UPI001A975117|nr:hypothetical protein [Pontibacillus sp. ALD_SL1]QST02859.1 hypothetical protein IMZ31_20125 [Pontibacillus sp. ALD_SL1]
MLFVGTRKVEDDQGFYYASFGWGGQCETRTPVFKTEEELDEYVRNNYGDAKNI